MKKNLNLLLLTLWVAISLVGCSNNRERSIVILSTNDIHSQIGGFPALATAIKQCRDTAEVILVDAGDKFTGNAFVDLVKYHTPIFELMNKLEFDLSIYGNHEFDWGKEYVAKAVEQANFDNLLANVISSDTVLFPTPQPYSIIERGGIKLAFVGVVGNDDNGHPSGKASSYEGLTFINPDDCAVQYGGLKDKCDVLILVSHSGILRDREYAASSKLDGYDIIISSHSHTVVDEVVNGIQISQTGNRLKNIGATVIVIKNGGEPQISYRNISLADYSPDAEMADMVEGYYHNPELTKAIGEAESEFSNIALINLFTSTIKSASNSDIGVYNTGGVRLDQLPKGDISVATILNAEPFSSKITLLSMTPAQLKKMIISKFNDKVNVGESHYIDLNCTAPYTIIRDENGDAIDVIFPTLKQNRVYTVAMGDYVALNYKDLEYSNMTVTEMNVADALKDYVSSHKIITPDNRNYQEIK